MNGFYYGFHFRVGYLSRKGFILYFINVLIIITSLKQKREVKHCSVKSGWVKEFNLNLSLAFFCKLVLYTNLNLNQFSRLSIRGMIGFVKYI